jgi:hypothetical protein
VPLAQLVSASLDKRRFAWSGIGVFAGSALILAMVGLYGVWLTSLPTDTGDRVRMALGAQRGDMLALILRQSSRLC